MVSNDGDALILVDWHPTSVASGCHHWQPGEEEKEHDASNENLSSASEKS